MATNLDSTTREIWDSTVYEEVMFKLVLVRLLLERGQVLRAGTAVKHTLDYDELDSLAQEYAENETLNGGKKTVMETAQWYPKDLQIPLEVSAKSLNKNQGGGDGQILPLEQRLVEKGQRAARLWFNTVLWRAGASARDAATHAQWQGLLDALTHDITYGGLSRATTVTRKYWQGASLADTFADQATQMTPTVANYRSCIDAVSAFMDSPSDIVTITSNTVYRNLQSQVEAQRVYKEGSHAKYGFTSMSIDETEIFAEPWLSSNRNSSASTTVKYLAMLNLKNWTLHLDNERKFGNFTGFVWQGQMQNAKDEYLGRLMLRGCLVCTQPNANIFKSNVTF